MVTHLDLFYQTRASFGVTGMDAATNPNTRLNEVPDKGEVSFAGDRQDRMIDCEKGEIDGESLDTESDPYHALKFLLERAMLDPDATVAPCQSQYQ